MGKNGSAQGEVKREHNERMAEELLQKALKELNLREDALLGMKANRPEKQAIAWLLNSSTTVTGVWLAERLKLGHSSNVSRAMRTFRETKTQTARNLRNVMTKCKGWYL